jgi:hypothetical protein
MNAAIEWLLASDEPWTRFGTLVDLLGRPADDAKVLAARAEMVAHPAIRALVEHAAAWPGPPIKRHNDASHPIYALSTLADFGLHADDPGMPAVVDAVLQHQSPAGAFLSKIHIPKAFGGPGEDSLIWVLCDTPTLLYALLALGMEDHPQVQRAVDHLEGLVDENGWHCVAAPELGKFKGPGRRSDPCPIANVYALKALAQAGRLDTPATRAGVEMLLWHWAHQSERKIFMFGIGTDFRKLKYPFVWYNLLHVLHVLSRFPFARADPRFHEMLVALTSQAGEDGHYTASSMYRAWKGWSFADKKTPSPWLTFLALRIHHQASG